ncbi:fimbrial protein [Cytobacillus sp. FJAT-54145]|uniref:Fimbrial protein n=1 Tax=Cytobacillus spartinae TaxID=3299023 RepID=A0ABW6KJP1_9BACI
MLVEINLLPKKEPKNKTLLLLVIIIGVIFLIGLISTYMIHQSYEKKLDSLNSEINETKLIVAQEQQKLVEFEQSNSVSELENTVTWAKGYPVKTVPLIKQLTALLPNRGFIQTFSYTESGEVSLSVQFDTSREAAYYLKNLLDSNFVKEAFLEALTTVEIPTANNNIFDIDDNNEKLVPRYMGEFKIMINRNAIEEVTDSSEVVEGEEE